MGSLVKASENRPRIAVNTLSKSMLQWGRWLKPAETEADPYVLPVDVQASMGPLALASGNDLHGRGRGRDLVEASMGPLAGTSGNVTRITLRYFVLSVSSMEPLVKSQRKLYEKIFNVQRSDKLQWGRWLKPAETRKTPQTPPIPARPSMGPLAKASGNVQTTRI